MRRESRRKHIQKVLQAGCRMWSGRGVIHPTSMFVAPASRAFSSSSLTAVARSKITCMCHRDEMISDSVMTVPCTTGLNACLGEGYESNAWECGLETTMHRFLRCACMMFSSRARQAAVSNILMIYGRIPQCSICKGQGELSFGPELCYRG